MKAAPPVSTAAYRLRDELPTDIPFLRRLYLAIRWAETEMMGMTDVAQRVAFLNQQFDLQRQHYRTAFHDAQFSVIELAGGPAGRLYLWRGPREHCIVDVSILPELSGRGVGTAILDDILAEAASLGRAVSLHVEHHNPARRLYGRKGFHENGQAGPYVSMIWQPPSLAAVARG